ncbi:MAG: DsbA family protein [Paraburkholderia tropica]|uniref:DsbA family oxidoreductase n=1 Tax=Paraburkholderia tropica TaxID=92647 RepID=UPI0031018346
MLRIDLYTEITCPWCLVGQYRLDKVLEERFTNLVVDIHHHPVLLMPNAPDAGLYIPDLLRGRYGVTDPKAAFARPEAEARASGLNLDLSRQLYAYPTQAAHALIEAARERGTQHELAVAITKAYFISIRNIASADVLAEVGTGYGFGRDEALAIVRDPVWRARVEHEAENSAAAGARSVPHFVFAGGGAINGARSEDEIALFIRQAISTTE